MNTKTSTRGFASMDPQRQREIAKAGGVAAHMKGTAHEFTSDEAREAGRKGGLASAAKRMKKNPIVVEKFNQASTEAQKA